MRGTKLRHLLATISGVIAAILVVFACHHSYASDNAELWPGSKYDSSIPTMREVLGYDPGTEIHSFAEILKYVDALSEAAPDRVRVFTYGTTWEGRNLTYIAIGSPKVIENLD